MGGFAMCAGLGAWLVQAPHQRARGKEASRLPDPLPQTS